MEEESRPALGTAHGSQEQLRQLLVATYRSRTPADIREAQALLMQGFQRAGFAEQVASLMVGQEEGTRVPTQRR